MKDNVKPEMLKVLIACEESQRVCIAFRKRGFEAYSADIQEPSGGHPEWHILGDVLKVLQGGRFGTMDGVEHTVEKWDLIIAFPPCTYLSLVATRHHSLKTATLPNINRRTLQRIEAMGFFMRFANAECKHIAIENPVGIMNTAYRSPNQVINPYQFAESVEDKENYYTKATCLWLKGLPTLATNNLPRPNNALIYGRSPRGKVYGWEEKMGGGKERSKNRSKTFHGVAAAMAQQWGDYLLGKTDKQLSFFDEEWGR